MLHDEAPLIGNLFMVNGANPPSRPPALLQTPASRRLLWFALIGIIVWGAMITWEATQFKRNDCPKRPCSASLACQLSSPIAELELAPAAQEFERVINQRRGYEKWNLEVARANTWMDFLFIALYWSVFWLLSLQYAGFLFGIVRFLISATAGFDIAENFRLLSSLRSLSWQQAPDSLPVSVSQVKWILFAGAVLVVGLILVRTKKFWPCAMAVLMVFSGLLTAGGVLHPVLLFPSLVLLFVSLLIAIFYYFPFGVFTCDRFLEWIEFGYLIRFQIIAAALLALILPAGYFAAPSIFIGIFDALGWRSFTFIVAASLQLSWTIMITTRLVLVYGGSRFSGIKGIAGKPNFPWSSAALFACLAIPVILITCCGTFLPWGQIVGSIILGIAIALLFLWLTSELHLRLETRGGTTAATVYPRFHASVASKAAPRSPTLLDRLLQKLPGRLQHGILSPVLAPFGELRSGHQLAAIAFGLLLAIYAVVGVYYSPGLDFGRHPPAALFYILYLVILLTWFFSGLAFFLDVLRLPVLTTFVAVSFLLGTIKTDHEFEITKSTTTHLRAPLPGEVVQTWETKRAKGDANKPIIVVATAGGGIRASAWTAEALTRLSDHCSQASGENPFASSLLLVSSVSGGSVGAMYVVGSYDGDGRLDQKLFQQIRQNAGRTSLSAVGWGFLYPDLLRMTPILGSVTGLIDEKVDRGWALENAWLRGWDGHVWQTPPTIEMWRNDVMNGTRPAVILNATAAEAGQRFIIASTTLNPNAIGNFEDSSTIQFSSVFENYNVEVSTAVRLSATFPWVSPMARASDKDAPSQVHVADGGYYDNSGVLSATEWLLEAKPAIGKRPVELILIDAGASSPNPGQSWSWQRQITAPIQTLLAVRTGSQELRASYELELVRDDLRSKGFNLETFRLSYPADPLTPLSWHLTPGQERAIGEAWFSTAVETEAKRIIDPLGCSK